MRRIPAAVLAATFIAGAAAHMDAYVRYPFKWKTSRVNMHMQLGSTPITLIDRAATWNRAASPGLSQWNAKMRTMQFVAVMNSGVPRVSLDGRNNVFFSSTVYGRPFGSRTLAVTLYAYFISTNAAFETDVIFNTRWRWNSYRGKLKSVQDIRRVAIHEFGHALGLNHSNASTAIMRPNVSNRDRIGADDIKGAQRIYGAR